MQTLDKIQSLHWQTSLAGVGIVENLADINQAIRVILGTPIGSDPLRPDFGSDLAKYIDWPIDRATAHVVRETVKAIGRWEKRVTVKKVVLTHAGAAHLALKVFWALDDATTGDLDFSL